MREERGQVSGDVVVNELYTLWGSIGGNVHVTDGGKLYVRGTIYGNLLVDVGGRVHVFGKVLGDLTVEPKAKVVHSGLIGGNAINNGGRLYIETTGKVSGKVKTKSGETKIHPPIKESDYT